MAQKLPTLNLFRLYRLQRPIFTSQAVRQFSNKEGKRSNLFGGQNPLKQMLKQADSASNSGGVHEEKRSNLFSQNIFGQMVDDRRAAAEIQQVDTRDYARSDVVYSYDLDQVLEVLKKSAIERGAKASHEFYYACLDRLDIIITERDSVVRKDEVVRILRDLAYFRPRDYYRQEKARKQAGNFTESEMQDDIISVRHKELIKKNSERFQTLPGHVAGFLHEHVGKGLLKDMFTQYDEEQQSKFKKTIFDVTGMYVQVYQNLEVRVTDMLAQDMFGPEEALDILVSYSVAEEGTNNMFLHVIQTMLTKRDPAGYNMVEVEMILNYFPHQVWSTETELKPLRDKFYWPILELIGDNMTKMDNRQFISVFQGMVLCGPKVFSERALNQFLNQYVTRIKPETESKLSEREVYQFLELLAEYLKYNKALMERIDSSQLMQLSCQLYLKNICKQMSPTQLAGLYWLCRNLGAYWDQDTLINMEARLVYLLENEIAIQKQLEKGADVDVPEGLQTWTLSNIELIDNYYSFDEGLLSKSKQAKQIQALVYTCKNWDKPEKSRKWFHW